MTPRFLRPSRTSRRELPNFPPAVNPLGRRRCARTPSRRYLPRRWPPGRRRPPPSSRPKQAPEDGNRALADVLIAEKLITPQAVDPVLKRLASSQGNATESTTPVALLQLLLEEQLVKLEDVLTVMVDRAGLPYLPLSTYDVDRDAVCLLPRELCFEKCIVPFDLISRSVLIATANPFDMAARSQAEVMLAYNVFWYVTSPEEIHVALRRAHGLDTKHPQGARTPGIS